MKKTSLWKKILLSFLSTILILIAVELTCRTNEKNYSFNTKVYLQKSKPALHRVSDIPGLSIELVPFSETEDGFFKINSRGIRDKEYLIPKPEDVFRIIVLGDSVTFGTEYPLELTYPKILEKTLNSAGRSHPTYEVLNAGVCSYNALQKFLLFKNRLLDYDPDMVIFQFINDDYYKNAVILPDYKGEGFHTSVDMGEYFNLNFPLILPLNADIDLSLKRYSALYRFLNKVYYDYLSARFPDKFIAQGYRYAGYADMEDCRKQNMQVFKKFKQLSEEHGFQFILMLVPDLVNAYNIDPWIREAGPKEFGFKTIDMFDHYKFIGLDLEGLRAHPEGLCHLNEQGHRITAQILAEWISADLNI